ncbi:AEC family transporter [Fusibacillus kribbianus]|uniref:AEC family transporter n=1 Tax=Fusibacillus kribbianus TaxID=3044208 RepID=A0AAP4EX70_9FIRM|nr:AEC family transporter [Ruminococcus sp. YH-rum2234]MDI9241467.1 AEC family transporter [Ruminococcus sp. YH-rum2234]
MNLALLLMKQIGVMFVLIGFGFIAVKCGIVSREDSKGISKLALYVIVPCILVNSFQIEFTKDTFRGLLIAFGASLAVNVLYLILTWLLNRKLSMSVIERASLIYPNAGNLIIPLVSAVLGEEMIIYCSAYIVTQNLFIWTHGKFMISGEKQLSLRKLFLNSSMLAILAGIVMAVTGLRLPSVLEEAVSSAGKAIAPVSMFVTGIIIGSMRFSEAFRRLRVYAVCFGRLIVYPMIVAFLMWFSNIWGMVPGSKDILFVVFLASAAPSASNIVQFAQVYEKDEQNAGLINVMSTLLCIITMPLCVLVYQML